MGVERLSSWLRGQENLYQSVRVNISNANLHGGQSSTCLVFDLRALGLYLCRYLSAPPDQCGDYSEFAASAHGVSSNAVLALPRSLATFATIPSSIYTNA